MPRSTSERESFYKLLKRVMETVKRARGVVPMDRIAAIVARLRRAAIRTQLSDTEIRRRVKQSLKGYMASPRIVGRMSPSQMTPAMRAELDKRINASVQLIKLNREERIAETLRRFQGWATSVPTGGTDADTTPDRIEIGKPMRRSTFELRRVEIDQGHKLIANVNDVLARSHGAIAYQWHDHGVDDKGYDARPAHMARSGKWFALKDGWAYRERLINKGEALYDDIDGVAVEPFCRCFTTVAYDIDEVPAAMLTAKGKAKLDARTDR